MAAKEDLAGIVGSENITDTPQILDSFSQDSSFTPPIKPQLVVKPGNAADVQAIINWARESGTPLVPVSSGPPRHHGDTVPGVSGAVIVDLSNMKKIMKIDRRNRVVIIEAGVTYPEVQPALAKEGMRLTTPLAPRANKSVLTALLERTPTLIPRQLWSALDPLRSTEIIWGDGNLLRTGDAGMWVSMEDAFAKKQSAVGSGGPGQADFYRFVSAAQGSMGIVTWVSAKCEVLPEPHKLYFAAADKLEDLIDFTYQILKFRFADELLVVNNATLASLLGDSPESTKSLMKEIPAWAVLVGIAGRSILPQERVAFQEKDISAMAQQAGLKLTPDIPGASGTETLEAILNPSREPYWKLTYRGGYQDILFVTTLDRVPEFVATMKATAEASGYPAADIGVYLQPLHQGASCHVEFTLPYNPENAEETARMEKLFPAASQAMLDKGAFYSRPYGIWAGMTYAKDPATVSVLKKLKGIFDPGNILNPGKLCF